MAEHVLPADFREFLKLLNEAEVQYLLIGGYAVGYHGYPRTTADMDVWVANRGWQVFVGADHGNTEATGTGAPSEGVLPETRGQRVRIYANETLRDKTAGDVADAFIWPPIGMPQGVYPLMASGRRAFASPGSTVVAHGGVSLEETIVPFVRVYS